MTIAVVSCIKPVSDTHTAAYVRSLIADGYRVASVCPGPQDETLQALGASHVALPPIRQRIVEGARLGQIAASLRQRIANSRQLEQALQSIDAQVILSIEPDSWAVALRARRFRVVEHLREVYDDRANAFPGPLRDPIRRLFRRSFVRMARRTDEIIHISRERQEVFRYLGKPGKVVNYYPSLHDSVLGRHSEEAKVPGRVIHAGMLRRRYGGEELLRAIESVRQAIPDLHLVVYGGISEDIRNRDLADRLIGERALMVHEKAPYEQVVAAMRQAQLGVNLVLPIDLTHQLAQPRKLYEYFAAGLPVLASDVPTIRAAVEDAGAGVLVDARSWEEIADSLARLLTRADLADFGQSGRSAFLDRYNWETQEPLMRQVFARYR